MLDRLKLKAMKVCAAHLTALRNHRPRLFNYKHIYFPRNFVGGEKVDLKQLDCFGPNGQPLIQNSLFPKTDVKCWLDRDDYKDLIEQRLELGKISQEEAEICKFFAENGYYVAKKLVSEKEVEAAFAAYDHAIENNKIELNPARRILNPHLDVPKINALLRHKNILKLCRLLLGESLVKFQSIGSHWGSEQREHSDAMHMSTYPLGFLIAAWVACEDVHQSSGPVVYYPGSHRLPYYLCKEVGFSPLEYFSKGRCEVYDKIYEPFIQNILKENNLKPKYLMAEKGDTLIWHHNLIHGGSKIEHPDLTRKAFVFHYYAKNAFKYHEVFGGVADIRF